MSAKNIEEVLKDEKISKDYKNKIILIQDYKKYFYKYFGLAEKGIYSKVSILEGDAVTYLVIASTFNEVQAHKEWFPFMGEFPYLGFFDKDSAEKYAKKMQKKKYHTYLRPVFAYSTLGYFEDRILSSFFHYSEKDLAELIFHELFHTIFFIKDNVDLNENLANYFGEQLMLEYFEHDKEKELIEERKNYGLVRQEIARFIEIYKQKIKAKPIKDLEQSFEIVNNFVAKELIPGLNKFCEKQKIKDCLYAKDETWNHAKFAAFMTYEQKKEFLDNARKQSTLKSFLDKIKKTYEQYLDQGPDISFSEFLRINL